MSVHEVRWSRIILPREHGVWGLLAGAALVGLPLGQNLAGCGLLLSAIAAIIGRQALAARAGWRTAVVLVPATSLATGGALLTWLLADSHAWLAWAAAGGGVAAGHAFVAPYLARPWWLSALAGGAFALLAGTVATAGNAPPAWAITGSAVLAAHLMATVPQVRACLRPRDPRWPGLTRLLHALIVLAAVIAWGCAIIPPGIPLVLSLGLARSAWIVDKRITMSAPARVGAIEMAWLPVLAAGIVLGLRG